MEGCSIYEGRGIWPSEYCSCFYHRQGKWQCEWQCGCLSLGYQQGISLFLFHDQGQLPHPFHPCGGCQGHRWCLGWGSGRQCGSLLQGKSACAECRGPGSCRMEDCWCRRAESGWSSWHRSTYLPVCRWWFFYGSLHPSERCQQGRLRWVWFYLGLWLLVEAGQLCILL